MMNLKSLAALGFALSVAAQAGAGELKIVDTTFGWSSVSDSVPTTGSSPISQYPAISVNQPIIIEFDSKLKGKTVNESTVVITSVSASVLAPLGLSSSVPGGQIAPVTLKAKKDTLQILPAVLFSGNSVSFGFAPKAYYLLEIRGKKSGVKGKSGDKLKKSVFIKFRTSDNIADPSPGAPKATIFVIDDKAGKVKLKETDPGGPVESFVDAVPNPAPAVRIDFNELVLPSTLLNPATGESPTIRIELDTDDVNTTSTDRVTVPGVFAVSNNNFKTTVNWTPTLQSVPPDRMYVVTVEPLIEDLVGNSEFSQTGDIGAARLAAFRTIDAVVVDLPPIVENFNGVLNRDADATSADWALSQAGLLRNGPGGGTGADGDFNPEVDTTIATGVFDPDLGVDVQKIWNFTSFNVGSSVTVRAVGKFPLKVRSTGPVNVAGTLDVSGEAAETFDENRIQPGSAGAAGLGGTGGGMGGSVTDGLDISSPLFGVVTGYAAATKVNQGLSGRSNVIQPFLFRAEATSEAFTGHAGLLLQPNTGTGSSLSTATPGNLVIHDHPSFVISSVQNAVIVNVVSDQNDPDYVGPLDQASLDLYELPPPPIAKVGDPFIFGDLSGHDGVATFGGANGSGSDGLSVAQSFITQVRSGGGGGGGARTPGEPGEDSPPAGLFGENTGTSGGDGGIGMPTGTVLGKTATTLTVQGTPFSALGVGGATKFIVIPNSTQSHFFEIASMVEAANTTITIVPITLPQESDADLDMNDILDLDDTTLGATCRVEPSFDVGGNGGAGSGVHLAGTTKLSGPPNLTLPTWTPGSGGGAGGGSVSIESAKRVSILVGGEILARGGAGGRTTGGVGTSASGGGAGGGGTIRLASADTSPFAVRVDGLASAIGGAGGLGFVDGGDGGDGRVRFESLLGNLTAQTFPIDRVEPAIAQADLGFLLPGLAPSVGQSLFYWTKSLFATYTGFTVTYDATKNGSDLTQLTYSYADFLAGTEPPFTITFNDALINSAGSIDTGSVDDDFTEDIGTLTGPFIRFRIVLDSEVDIEGDIFTNVQIDQVVLNIAG